MSRAPHIRRASRPVDSYTLVSNEFCRSKLPPRAKVVALLLLSHRDGYMVTQERMAEDLGMSRTTVGEALQDLEQAGLCVREQVRDERGHVLAVDWVISDTPIRKNQSTESGHRSTQVRPESVHPVRTDSGHYKKTKGEDYLKDSAADATGVLELDLPLPAVLEKQAEDEMKALNKRASVLAQRHYERLGKVGNIAAWIRMIKKVLSSPVLDYSDEQVDDALKTIADTHLTVTEERLVNTLRGGPKFGNQSRPEATPPRKRYQYRADGRRGMEMQVDW